MIFIVGVEVEPDYDRTFRRIEKTVAVTSLDEVSDVVRKVAGITLTDEDLINACKRGGRIRPQVSLSIERTGSRRMMEDLWPRAFALGGMESDDQLVKDFNIRQQEATS